MRNIKPTIEATNAQSSAIAIRLKNSIEVVWLISAFYWIRRKIMATVSVAAAIVASYAALHWRRSGARLY
jgi:hypothetical protein